MTSRDSFSTRSALCMGGASFTIFSLRKLEAAFPAVARFPFSLRILLENMLRNEDGRTASADDIRLAARWAPGKLPPGDIPFLPSRVVLQDFTGVPCIVDLAAMRDAVRARGGDPAKVNPIVPVDLVIDHSVQVDAFGTPDALQTNARIEYERNRERYAFLRWGQRAFRNLRVIPPDTGIVHQVNLEYLSPVVDARDGLLFPDTLMGTDSHTTMINGLGVLGWGVGGIEAEAAMLGYPTAMPLPEVIGFRLTGTLGHGATATDAVLTITEILRKKGVVGKFVEFFGPGLANLSLPDRATIANMAPEYGATMGFFPVDDETLRYLRLTGRPDEVVARVESYNREQGLFRTDATPDPLFTDTLELDLSTVWPCMAGPKRPQDRVILCDVAGSFRKGLTAPVKERGFELPAGAVSKTAGGLAHGSVVIAAITSCTNTSNPSVMIGAGLLAKKAVERGLKSASHVKTSLAPGSQVVEDYLKAAGLLPYLEKLGFHLVGFGCTTCIGNSGPLSEAVSKSIKEGDLVAAAVLSGNRNFEGRIHPQVRAAYLASPPLVVAYALAGRVDLDLTREPIGTDTHGKPVMLTDIWPAPEEIRAALEKSIHPQMFRDRYRRAAEGDALWKALPVPEGDLYSWDGASTYIRRPPYFEAGRAGAGDFTGARCLALLGDSITTDHISPAGSIAANSPAARYFGEHGVASKDFNSYGARRGNHEVMMRGTFANVRLKNLMAGGVEGNVTVHVPSGKSMPIYDAAMEYAKMKTPLLIVAGKEYGSGSSRDWAAKGVQLQGVRAVIAESYERIHRSNLVGMGVLPLEFLPGESAKSYGITGAETFDIMGISKPVPRGQATLRVRRADGATSEFQALIRIDTTVEVEYYQAGGILPAVLEKQLSVASN